MENKEIYTISIFKGDARVNPDIVSPENVVGFLIGESYIVAVANPDDNAVYTDKGRIQSDRVLNISSHAAGIYPELTRMYLVLGKYIWENTIGKQSDGEE